MRAEDMRVLRRHPVHRPGPVGACIRGKWQALSGCGGAGEQGRGGHGGEQSLVQDTSPGSVARLSPAACELHLQGESSRPGGQPHRLLPYRADRRHGYCAMQHNSYAAKGTVNLSNGKYLAAAGAADHHRLGRSRRTLAHRQRSGCSREEVRGLTNILTCRQMRGRWRENQRPAGDFISSAADRRSPALHSRRASRASEAA